VDWRIYYGDGSTYSDEDGPVEDAPAQGVQAVVTRSASDPRQVISVHGWDYYWQTHEGEFYGGELFGLYDALLRRCHPIFFGRTIPTADWQAVVARSVKDKLDG
jgi:hypothetical protein